MSWSLVTLSGRFCKNKILLGGRYSSGICTAGRLGAGAAAAPSTITMRQPNRVMEKGARLLSAAILFVRNFCLRGLE
jgi:hypothetical protein